MRNDILWGIHTTRYPSSRYTLLQQGGLTGFILVGWLDLLDFYKRDTHVNPKDRFLLISIKVRVAWHNFGGIPKAIISISV